MRGGFSRQWVKNALAAATTGYKRMVIAHNESGEPMNRPSTYKPMVRAVKKLTSKTEWFKYNTKQPTVKSKSTVKFKFPRDNTSSKCGTSTSPENQPEAVLFIPHTPGGTLKKEISKVQESFNKGKKFQNIRIVERQGPKVGTLIANPAP